MNHFSGYHPAVLFIYYALAVGFSMLTLHPCFIFASFFGAFLFFFLLFGWRSFISEFLFFMALLVLVSVTNPMFVHHGETVLFFMNDNPVTLEAIIYGILAAWVIICVIVWCRCYSEILTTDKFLYLFGRFAPRIGLILSMVFRFIPLFKKQITKTSSVQKAMGLYASPSISDKVGGGMRVADSMFSWATENAIDTADAMKARGYGLPGRTNFSLFRFIKKDAVLLGIIGALAALIIFWIASGKFYYYTYPVVPAVDFSAPAVIRYVVVLIFFSIPGLIELKEKIQWNYLVSKA